jgi:nucleotide-binding universal stress UspA family protein
MDINNRKPIVVAVGDEDEPDAAVRFAAAEAVRDGCPLRIVHVIHPPALGPGPEQMLLSFDGAEIVGEQLLQAAVDRAEEIVAGRVPVGKRLGRGPVVPVLVELSEHADRVVLQHRNLSGLRRVFTGSVCSGVAGRAHAPVVSVPERWTTRDTARVVVGVDDSTGLSPLLEPAFELAADRKASLVVLHAWYIPSMYGEAMLGRSAVEKARKTIKDQIADEMAVWQSAYPTVDAELVVSHARPADALVALSRDSDLLLLGRRSAAHSLTHLGSVARALIRESRCPVMVLPPASERAADAEEPNPVEAQESHRS